MLNWTNFRNTVASVICTLDCVEYCDWTVLVDSMINTQVTSSAAVEVLQTLERKGLVAFEWQPNHHTQLVCVTAKGRMMAANIRAVTTESL